jgi:predicted PurR-regulated permease PerM
MNEPTPVPRWLEVFGGWGWRLVVGTAALAIVGLLLLKFIVVVVPVALALFLASPLEPLVSRLRARGLRPALAAFVVFMGFLLVIGSALVWIGSEVVDEMDAVGDRAEEGLDDIQEWASETFDLSEQELEDYQEQFIDSIRAAGESGGIAGSVLGQARTAVEVVGGFVLMLFTLFFILKDGRRMGAWIMDVTPERYREDAAEIGRRGRVVLRRFLVAVALTGLVDALLIGLALALIGVPLVLPLATLTFLGAFVPIIGAFVAGLLAALVALVTNGFTDALLVVIATVVVQQVEGNILQPFIFGPVVKIHELVTVLSVAAGLAVFGILGAFFAVPVVALGISIGNFYRTREAVP